MDSELAPVMQQTNKMLKEFNEANKIEETLLDYQDNRQEMEQNQERIDQLCHQMGVQDHEVDDLMKQYEREELGHPVQN